MENADEVLLRRVPVELVHPPVPDEGCVNPAEVIASDDDRDARDRSVLAPVAAVADEVRVVAYVHQRADDHLVVDGALSLPKAADPRVEVVDEEAAELPLVPDDGGGLAVAVPDEPPGRARILALELPRAHDNGDNPQLLERELRLEGFALAFRPPDSENERNARVQTPLIAEDVLGNVQSNGFQKSWSNIVFTNDIVQATKLEVSETPICNI
mmetsp:Transcript_33069/g.78427  ORF Transcript_33069/g.78427 Transcript_33069/m.78427 type:complete len:213 (-) Transcript_33069:421-1059(-)